MGCELGAGNSAGDLSGEVPRGAGRGEGTAGPRGRGDPVEVGSLVRAGVLHGSAAGRRPIGEAAAARCRKGGPAFAACFRGEQARFFGAVPRDAQVLLLGLR